MSGKLTIAKFMPALFKSIGPALPITLNLDDNGPAKTAAFAGLDYFVVPPSNNETSHRDGSVMKLATVCYTLGSLGTGGTGGGYTVNLSINGVIIGTSVVTIAYNAANRYQTVDLRDASGKGVSLNQNDVLAFNLTAVPTGAPTGAVGLSANVRAGVYDISV